MEKNGKERLFEVMSKIDDTFKPRLNEELEIKGKEEKPEKEGNAYKESLKKITKLSKKISKKIPEGELPAWIQDKITVANENLTDINKYFKGHKDDEKVDDEDEKETDEDSDDEEKEEDKKEDEE